MTTIAKSAKANLSLISGEPAKELIRNLFKVIDNDFTPEEKRQRSKIRKELEEVKLKMKQNGNPWGI